MKIAADKFLSKMAIIWTMTLIFFSQSQAAPIMASSSTNAPKSVFTMPESPKDGRDPFFPNSMHPYVEAHQQNNAQPQISDLKLQGLTRARGHVYVIINDETFGVGDEADVKTPTGKIHVRCVQIKANDVIIEAAGQLVTLTLSNQ